MGESEAERNSRLYTSDSDRAALLARTNADRELRRQEINAQIAAGNYGRNRQSAIDRGRGIGAMVDTASGLYNFGRNLYGSFGSSSGGSGLGYGTIDPTQAGDGFPYSKGGRVHDIGLGDDEGSERTPDEEAGERFAKKTEKRRPVFRKGGRVRMNYESGGRADGPGTATSDSIRARLSDGEGVLNSEAMELLDAQQPGALEQLNHSGLLIRAARKHLRTLPTKHDVGLGD